MNPLTIGVIVAIFVVALIYLIIKNRSVNILTNHVKAGNYQAVIDHAMKPFHRKLLGDYYCDLYMIRAYYLMKDMLHLKSKAIEMLNADYKSEQRKNFLELYYHIFLNLNDMDMTNRFLNEIVKVEDQAFVRYNQYAYHVLIEKEDDLIDTMEAEISAKMYSGFSLGTVVYLIAMQYLYKKDYANAELYFKECLTCLHPNAFYVDLAKKHIKELENID